MDNLEKFLATSDLDPKRIELGVKTLDQMEDILHEGNGLQVFRIAALIVVILAVVSVGTLIYMIFVGMPQNLDQSLKRGGYILILSWGLLCVLLPSGLLLSAHKLSKKSGNLSRIAEWLTRKTYEPGNRSSY